jgi:hypothetical protein
MRCIIIVAISPMKNVAYLNKAGILLKPDGQSLVPVPSCIPFARSMQASEA